MVNLGRESGPIASSCGAPGARLSYRLGVPAIFSGGDIVYWFGVLFAAVGAGGILGALTFVSLLIGGMVTGMIVLMCGPIIDRLLARRSR
jgi:hypothetical protein